MNAITDSEVINEMLRQQWRKTIEGEGGNCPCCGKWGKVYRMRLTHSLVLSLRWIMVHGEDQGWVNVQKYGPRWMLRSKTYPLLAHWGLIQSKGKRSGFWRTTAYGRDFVGGYAIVPDAVFIYDNMVWGTSKTYTTFRACLDKNFDFDALMSDGFNWSKVQA